MGAAVIMGCTRLDMGGARKVLVENLEITDMPVPVTVEIKMQTPHKESQTNNK